MYYSYTTFTLSHLSLAVVDFHSVLTPRSIHAIFKKNNHQTAPPQSSRQTAF